jgi:hypothetical protein
MSSEPTLSDEECGTLWRANVYNFEGQDSVAVWYRKVLRAAYALGLAAGRWEQSKTFLAAANDLHTTARHVGDFQACSKHKCIHLRESAAIEKPGADTEPRDCCVDGSDCGHPGCPKEPSRGEE